MTLIFFLFDNEQIKKKNQKKMILASVFCRLFSHDLNIGADAFYQPLQSAPRTEFHKLGGPIGNHSAHGLRPPHRTGELRQQVLPYLFRV
jgi:hypothetical protein